MKTIMKPLQAGILGALLALGAQAQAAVSAAAPGPSTATNASSKVESSPLLPGQDVAPGVFWPPLPASLCAA